MENVADETGNQKKRKNHDSNANKVFVYFFMVYFFDKAINAIRCVFKLLPVYIIDKFKREIMVNECSRQVWIVAPSVSIDNIFPSLIVKVVRL